MIQFFNCFEVPAGQEDEFFRLWTEVNHYMVTKPGYVSHQLHRSVDADARYRFLNHGVWRSAEHWRAAHDQGFRALVSRPEWAAFTSTPGLYDVVHEGSVDPVPALG
ncbi:antibiotic biosynthesis monooxygenase family protein [uncultured Friedmanniella sp.]|uniref:antibiotic biosynthesis monooxygenase family protein n=1 Tax=uncultured Friedmanniella sp. TaxID=335381 RepID=UPI0035C9C0CF